MKKVWISVVLISFIVISDQITKWLIESSMYYGQTKAVIDGFFNLSYVKNTGAAWGLLGNSKGMIRYIFLNYLPVAACFYFIFRMIKDYKRNFEFFGFTFIVAGAIGNLIDRFSQGYVVDFLDFHIGYRHFPSFNVADSSITIGACLILLSIFLEKKMQKSENA